MAPRKLFGERKNGPVTYVTTRRSNRIAAAGTHSDESDQIAQTAARANVAKTQRRHQVEASQSDKATSVAQAVDKETAPIDRNKLPRKKPNTGNTSAAEASRTSRKPRLSPGRTPQPKNRVQPGAAPVSGSAKGTKRRSRSDDDAAPSPVVGKRARIHDGRSGPEDTVGAKYRAQSGGRISAPPVEHVMESGASIGMKRRSQEANDDNSSPGSSKRARKYVAHPSPTGNIGSPSEAPSEDLEHETSPPKPSGGQELSKLILLAVITHRVVRRREDEHYRCERLLEDANREIETRQRDLGHRYAYVDPEARRVMNREVEDWEAVVPERKADEARAGRKKRYLNRQLGSYIEKLPSFLHASREDDALKFLVESENFWQCFNRLQGTNQAMDDLVIETEEAQQELKALRNAAELLHRRSELGDDPRISIEMEQNMCGNMDDLPGVMCRLDDLEDRRAELKRALKTAAIDVLWSAEETFVSSKILERDGIQCSEWRPHNDRYAQLQDDLREQEESPENEDSSGREEDPSEQDDPHENDGAPAELSIPEQLELAQSVLQRARDEFEGARTLTQEEIAQLPQPVTEDAKGVAMVQKLGQRTRALIDATQAWKDIYERARKAEFTSGREQTADYSDREDDGDAESLHEELIAQSRYRVGQDWAGLHPIDREASPPSGQLDRSLLSLHSPGMGEDSFEDTHARDRNRDRIDAITVEGYNIRERGSFPEAEADELIFE